MAFGLQIANATRSGASSGPQPTEVDFDEGFDGISGRGADSDVDASANSAGPPGGSAGGNSVGGSASGGAPAGAAGEATAAPAGAGGEHVAPATALLAAFVALAWLVL